MSRLKWRIADLVNRAFYRRQCWADLVSWVLDSKRTRDEGLRARLPWRPINEHCLRDAESAGRCYCGKVGSDGTVLGRGESVCVTRMPGRERDRLCSRPGGHEPPHRCGAVEWEAVGECQGADFSKVAAHLAAGLEQHADRDGLTGPLRAVFLARGGHAPGTACPSEPREPVHGQGCALLYDGDECDCGAVTPPGDSSPTTSSPTTRVEES